MRTIYIPTIIADECFLKEALCWVAFQEYPQEAITEHDISYRRDAEYQEDFEARAPIETLLDFMSEDNCKRWGLPTSLDEEQRDNYRFTDVVSIDKMLNDKNIEEKGKTGLREQRVYALEYNKKRALYNKALEDFLEAPKHKLYLAIKEGKIKCYGKRVGELDTRDDIYDIDFSDDENWKMLDDWSDVFEPLTKDFWRFEGIDWFTSTAKSLQGYYIHVVLDFKDMVKEFPEQFNGVKQVYIGNGCLISLEDDSKVKTANIRGKGRPPLNWDSFHIEVAHKIKNEGMPDKQESFISDMQSWCREHWHRDVGRSTILQKLSPYYRRFKKSENS